ncbi:MAG: hypothetical protein MRZ73_01755 [Pseudoflavonifractor capillosus]|uniref:hypothetical protein n=1 Tax=Pseudoflavonifractor capillosus TaxID=106588 RepID=UPI0023F660BC|nr:hypothetical protein [Pseudoflavonifractor capillosus]MCI5927253.1 hypothetical protein [Pseudoflavonifractor capillosus]
MIENDRICAGCQEKNHLYRRAGKNELKKSHLKLQKAESFAIILKDSAEVQVRAWVGTEARTI